MSPRAIDLEPRRILLIPTIAAVDSSEPARRVGDAPKPLNCTQDGLRSEYTLSPPDVARRRAGRRKQTCFRRDRSARALQVFAGHSKIAAAPRYPDPEVLLMRTAPVAAGPPPVGAGRDRCRPDALCPLLRQEQHSLRFVPVVHLHDRPLRDLLLPGDREAPGACRQLRGERLPAESAPTCTTTCRSRCR